jgi:hypothetical protein
VFDHLFADPPGITPALHGLSDSDERRSDIPIRERVDDRRHDVGLVLRPTSGHRLIER